MVDLGELAGADGDGPAARGVAVRDEPEPVDVPQTEPLKNECLQFLDCIAHDKKPVTDGYEGLRVLKVLAQAQKHIE